MPHDPELTPSEEQVRRLLADARHTEPLPHDVAARLDGVLTGLAAERRDADQAARSVAVAADLAAARRRRTARNLLVAAAAIVAIGVGMNSVDLTVSGGDEDSAASDAGGDGALPEAATGPREGQAEADRGPALESPQDSELADKPGRTTSTDGSVSSGYDSGTVVLSSARFGAQVRRLQADRKAAWETAAGGAVTDGLFSLGRDPLRPGCSTRGWGEGLLVPARYDGDLGALVFREPRGETQVVDLYVCGNDDPLRSITLTTR